MKNISRRECLKHGLMTSALAVLPGIPHYLDLDPKPEAQLLRELDLIKLLDQFEDVVDSAARQLAPHQISFYVQELASALHSFYANNPILNAKDENTIAARLCLLKSVSKVIRNGLNLVGVEAPESM